MQTLQDDNLSDRELEILRLVATGASNKEIAQILFISANTVKVHLRNIFAKIGVESRTEAAMYAVRTGLTPTHTIGVGIPEADAPTVIQAIDESPVGAMTPLQEEDQAFIPTRPEPQVHSRRWIWAAALAGVLALIFGGTALFVRGVFLVRTAAASPTPASNPRWKLLPPLPTPRQGLAVTAYENTLFAIGGETQQGPSAAVEKYDPQTNSWVTLPAKPTPVSDISATILGGKIYVPGGKLADGNPSDSLEIYDPRLQQWEQGPRLPVALSAYAMAVYEGRLFLFGGWDGKTYLSSVYEFNTATNTWQERTPMPTARGFCGAVFAGGDIYVFGGYDGKQALVTNEVYRPSQDNGTGSPWSQAAPLPAARYAMGATSIADLVLVVGGKTSPGQTSPPLPPLQYRLETRSWLQLENVFPSTWDRMGLVGLGTQLYSFGGEIDGKLSEQAVSYQVMYTIVIPLLK